MAKWEDGLGEWRGRELSLAHKQHFQAQEIALPPDMAPLRYLRVVYAKARGDEEGAGWKSCVSAVGPLRTINHSLLDGQREEGGRRNSLDSICPHLRYNGLINGRGIVSVFGVVPVLFASPPILCSIEGWRAFFCYMFFKKELYIYIHLDTNHMDGIMSRDHVISLFILTGFIWISRITSDCALCCSWTYDSKLNNGKNFTWILSHCNKWSLSAHNEITLHLEALYSFVLTRGPDARMLGWTLALQTHNCAAVAIIVSHGTMTTSQTCWLTSSFQESKWTVVVYIYIVVYSLLYMLSNSSHSSNALDFTTHEGKYGLKVKKLSTTPSFIPFTSRMWFRTSIS